MAKMPKAYNLLDFMRDYPSDDACLDKLCEMRYGREPVCDACGKATKYHRIKKRKAYSCQWCGHHVYPCAGTPFEKSRTGLQKWFYAMFLFTTTRHGVPAKELERQLGVTYKTAWRMGHIIRELMNNIGIEKLIGEVEIDESYVGGRRPIHSGRGRGAQNKTIVLGMKQRGGNMIAMVIPDVKRATIQPLIEQYVRRGAIVHTDEWWAYHKLRQAGFDHRTVRHGAGEYDRDGSNTNAIENFWARLKLSIRGTHIHVSSQHLQKYVTEFAFRYNYRNMPDRMFAVLLASLGSPAAARH